MRILSIVTVVGVSAIAMAQQPNQQRAFISAADVDAMVAKAKNERKPDQASVVSPI